MNLQEMAKEINSIDPCPNKIVPECMTCKYIEPQDADYNCLDLAIAEYVESAIRQGQIEMLKTLINENPTFTNTTQDGEEEWFKTIRARLYKNSENWKQNED